TAGRAGSTTAAPPSPPSTAPPRPAPRRGTCTGSRPGERRHWAPSSRAARPPGPSSDSPTPQHLGLVEGVAGGVGRIVVDCQRLGHLVDERADAVADGLQLREVEA